MIYNARPKYDIQMTTLPKMPKSLNDKKDMIYQQTQGTVAAFKFDARVASVFADMISRSVPGYQQILNLLPTLVRQYGVAGHNYYDLGCSLGAGMLAIAQGLSDKDCTIIGVDTSEPMLREAKPTLDLYAEQNKVNFELQHADIIGFEYSPAAMVLMNFTLQFIAVNQRDQLVNDIYAALCPGGVLVLSEKIKFDHADTNDALIKIYHQYKADQGYSDMEISQKRDAIENVLIPETLGTHHTRLQNAGFKIITPWVQNLQFVSLLAIK
ncbi:MAG: tRNA (cmo5U34)-methyltransferase [Arenicella sp.]|jgi:tRNA (cmo5U34)-methyltransferase